MQNTSFVRGVYIKYTSSSPINQPNHVLQETLEAVAS